MMDLRARSNRTCVAARAALLVWAAVALAACGDGSGDGEPPRLYPGGPAAAAGAEPVAGSVTQSSDAVDGVTANPVTATLAVRGMALAPTVESRAWRIADPDDVERGTQAVTADTTLETMEFGQALGDGSRRTVFMATDATPTALDDGEDYLVMGHWLRVPRNLLAEDGSIDMERSVADLAAGSEFGAFADGSDPFDQGNIMALTGEARYDGPATAVYIDTADDKHTRLSARVSLIADFETGMELGTVRGSVRQFQTTHDGMPGPRDLSDAEATALPDLTLDDADIGDSDSGFFTGNTRMSDGSYTLTGKWGGQFYGNGAMATDNPAAVAGTFGAADETKAIVGSFAAPIEN